MGKLFEIQSIEMTAALGEGVLARLIFGDQAD